MVRSEADPQPQISDEKVEIKAPRSLTQVSHVSIIARNRGLNNANIPRPKSSPFSIQIKSAVIQKKTSGSDSVNVTPKNFSFCSLVFGNGVC